jgi:hypothetical protein
MPCQMRSQRSRCSSRSSGKGSRKAAGEDLAAAQQPRSSQASCGRGVTAEQKAGRRRHRLLLHPVAVLSATDQKQQQRQQLACHRCRFCGVADSPQLLQLACHRCRFCGVADSPQLLLQDCISYLQEAAAAGSSSSRAAFPMNQPPISTAQNSTTAVSPCSRKPARYSCSRVGQLALCCLQ